MKTIVILNGKGGVGKSNITRHLAVIADQERPGEVVLCDTDPQGSLADWWNAREAETPQLALVSLSDFSEKQPKIALQFNFLFFDTAAAHAKEYEQILASADLIIVPVSVGPDDIRSLNRITLPVLKASNKPFIFVMSKARLGTKLLLSTVAALSEHGPVCPTIICQREGYAESALAGSTLVEDEPKGKGAAEMRELWEFVKSRIDEKTVSNTKKNKKELLNV